MSNPPRTPNRTRPPAGWRRSVARLPVHLYRLGLGPVFGGRMLLLTHTGRVSGRPRQVVIEVVAHDAVRRAWTVASGYGPQSQWYRNLRHTPRATVQVGRHRHEVSATFLDAEEGADVMAEYAPRHPRAARALCRYLGLPSDGTPESYRAAGRQIPFVRLTG
ncbi:nitroreductase family deazaflavin-dependent oxidoreductase [Streptomyces sp. CA-111067]|uniref:nitroreductase family deazaflavin-dependent oxidoreductase n=1 Tax=Streptomyces sp. CA-111067 TaxID=3240046 RepID=UPI003D996A0D